MVCSDWHKVDIQLVLAEGLGIYRRFSYAPTHLIFQFRTISRHVQNSYWINLYPRMHSMAALALPTFVVDVSYGGQHALCALCRRFSWNNASRSRCASDGILILLPIIYCKGGDCRSLSLQKKDRKGRGNCRGIYLYFSCTNDMIIRERL